MSIKVVNVVGARPQFIKASAVSRAIRRNFAQRFDEVMVHTGQHFDDNMSQVFFDELQIPAPQHHLKISGGGHGAMTGRMLEAVERVLLDEKPDWVLIYGDTNSTLAGALAAAKLHIPLAHVEAGLRSFNMKMPEEINRIVADRLSTRLFCPTDTAVKNLSAEGISQGVHNVGDVMYDVALFEGERAARHSTILQTLKLSAGEYALATCHRAENTDSRHRLESILAALATLSARLPVVLPLHPRTAKLIDQFGLSARLEKLIVTAPLPFLDMVALEQSARVILTDSGGVQKEAFFFSVPAITLRDETEWVETLELGWNRLAGADTDAILSAFDAAMSTRPAAPKTHPYGTGQAAHEILGLMLDA